MILVSSKFPLFWFGAVAVTMFGNVFVSKRYWGKIGVDKKNCLMLHEAVHLVQQEEGGLLWYLKYIFSKKFRLEQEIEAYLEEIRYRLKRGFNLKDLLIDYATRLSSRTYGYMTTYNRAHILLELNFINNCE